MKFVRSDAVPKLYVTLDRKTEGGTQPFTYKIE
ncbi:protein of unknown function [Burkholderia multivorans]